MKKATVVIGLLLVLIIFASGCARMSQAEMEQRQMKAIEQVPRADGTAWRDIVLTDVITSESFRVRDFAGEALFVESFAVWCPVCLEQQKELNQLEGMVIHISVDTDPNEDKAKVVEHVQRNNLKGKYAVAPIEMTQSLIDEFGFEVVSAPSAPVILICEDQSARLLRRGVKSVDELLSEVDKC